METTELMPEKGAPSSHPSRGAELDLESHSQAIFTQLEKQNFELTVHLLSQLLSKINCPQSFYTIVWTVISQLHRNGKNTQLHKIIDLFMEYKNENFDVLFQKVGPQIEDIVQGKKQQSICKTKNVFPKSYQVQELKDFKKDLKRKLLKGDKSVSIDIFQNLKTYYGLLQALFKFGNTLELLYVGGMVIPNGLIPFYIDFKSKKCHACSRPIINFKKALFCTNIFLGIDDLNQACYKFVCKDCLQDNWTVSKNNLLYKCACCRGQCPKYSICSSLELVRNQPQYFVGKDMFWYHWRGKRSHVRGTIDQFDKIRKMHKIKLEETGASHKLCLEKESFFEIDRIPRSSEFQKIIAGKNTINFKDLINEKTNTLVKSRGKQFEEYIMTKYHEIKAKQQSDKSSKKSLSQRDFLSFQIMTNPHFLRQAEEVKVPNEASSVEPSHYQLRGGDEPESIVKLPNTQIKITTSKQLNDLLKQNVDITQFDIDDKLLRGKKQYYDQNDPFKTAAKAVSVPQVASGGPMGNQKPINISVNNKNNNQMKSSQNVSNKIAYEDEEQISDQVKTFQTIAKQYPENIVGQTIYVFSQSKQVWSKVKVLKYLEGRKKYKVKYDDKTIAPIDLQKEQFVFEKKSCDIPIKPKTLVIEKVEPVVSQKSKKAPKATIVLSKHGKILGKRLK